ncbi:MAG: hypothetical protein KBT20_06670 [Bacteroidales bacterium]|nr:hypothetical protein [Candidatus Liminaster caballi]
MNRHKPIEEQKQAARARFANHKATVVQQDENFLIMDWRHISGTSDYFVRYILDLKLGQLIVTGDLGDSIACWYNAVTPENMSRYVRDINYYMGKLKATSDRYDYDWEDIKADIDALEKEYREMLDDYEDITEEDFEEDFENIRNIFDEINVGYGVNYPTELIEIFEKYNTDWWESAFADIGQRISPRIVLWSVGFQMAWEQVGGGCE